MSPRVELLRITYKFFQTLTRSLSLSLFLFCLEMGSGHATWREELRDVPNSGFLRETSSRGWQFALTFASMMPGGLESLKLSMCVGNCRMPRLG